MNKTININLAGIFFHIDENAYIKLQHYLEAIKQSFTDTQGQSEIISDIEARIAELFSTHLEDHKHVISTAEVDEVIAIMGQPEDYIVDDTIFEEAPKQHTYAQTKTNSTLKRLFRDTDNSYVGGVCSGLGHYFGIDAIWIRLAWILLISAAGGGLFIYILLWILVPEAKTTAEKIIMTGEPVTISNIEKKVKDGFNTVSDTVNDMAKNVKDATAKIDVETHKNRIKSSSKSFFGTISEGLVTFLKLFSRCIGGGLMLIGIVVIIGLVLGLPALNIMSTIQEPPLPFYDFFNSSGIPLGLTSLIIFFLVGIPFFFLFYLGLKLLIINLKSIGNIAKFSLLGLWLLSLVGVAVIGIIKASERAFEQSYFEKTTALPLKAKDTLYVKMATQTLFPIEHHKRGERYKLNYDSTNTKMLYSKDVGIVVKSTTDSIASISIKKNAKARTYGKALERAKAINYKYHFSANTLILDPFSKTAAHFNNGEQAVNIILYVPEHSVVYFSGRTQYHLYRRTHYGNIINTKKTNQFLEVLDGTTKCLDCPPKKTSKHKKKHKHSSKNVNVKISTEGIEIKTKENNNSI